MSELHEPEGLPNTWRWSTVDELATVVRGGSPRPAGDPRYFGGSAIPWITVGSLTADDQPFLTSVSEFLTEEGKQRSRYLEADTLLLTNSGATLGVPKITRIAGCINDGSVALLGVEYPLKLYLYYYLKSLTKRLRAIRQGAAQPNLNTGIVKAIRVPVAPEQEQHRIVAKIEELFSDLDAAVAALKRAKANLKNYRAAVLKAAVEGKLTAEWRAKNPTEPASKLLERILAERRRKWEADQLAKFAAAGNEPPKNWKAKYVEPKAPETSGLPELPAGWCWVTLPQLGMVDRGRSRHRPRNAPHLYGGPYPFVQTGDIRHADTYIRSYEQTYSESGLKQSKLWPAGTLCITIAANIAETAILTFDSCFPDSVVGFIPASEAVSVRFVELFFQTAQERLEAFAPATAQKNLNLETLNQVAIPLPPSAEQLRIITDVDEQLSRVRAANRIVEADEIRADRLREAILKRAFEGKLVPQDASDVPACSISSKSPARAESSWAITGRTRRACKNAPEATNETR